MTEDHETELRDHLEHAAGDVSLAISREIHHVVREAIAKLREELAAGREAEADATAAYFRKAMRELDTEKVEG